MENSNEVIKALKILIEIGVLNETALNHHVGSAVWKIGERFSNWQQAQSTLLSDFETLIRERTVVFNHDEEDGYFIKVTEKGDFKVDLNVAELIDQKHENISSAIQSAIDYMSKKDSDFEKLLFNIHNRLS